MTATVRVDMHPTESMVAEFNLTSDSWETDLETFISDNDLDAEEADILRTNPLGVGYTFGGGAAPLFVVTRIA